MNVVEIDYSDLQGKQFNGFELHQALRKKGITASQIVKWKESKLDTVHMYADDKLLDCQIRAFEKKYSVQNLLFPYADDLVEMKEFQEADIAHYHLIHKGAFSLLDIPNLMMKKKSVWTLHDPWIVTGKCVHPLECIQWKCGCQNCVKVDDYFQMREHNEAFMWKIKREIMQKINPYIVVSCSFMKNYIRESPITKHFDRVYEIPFGVDINSYQIQKRNHYREKIGISNDKFVIAFRCDDAEIKGCKYIYDAFRKLGRKQELILLCVGSGSLPEDLQRNFKILNLGWINNSKYMAELLVASDLFLMPSLAETFGVMAIEAMAAGCAVLCFENTVLTEITDAPHCGIAVEYQSASEIAKRIVELEANREFAKELGIRGHKLVKEKYRFEEYVNKHIHLYEEIMNS